MKNIRLLVGLSLSVMAANAIAEDQNLNHVVRIGHAIQVLQPKMSNSDYFKHALGIWRASQRYGIAPAVLIAIAQQESGFRTNLPEGPAGEIGTCQIIKSWLTNNKFKAEFGKVTVADLNNPTKSYLYAAWILRELQETQNTGALPYWSYYNSRKFDNRLKYFLKVNEKLSQMRKKKPEIFETLSYEPARQVLLEKKQAKLPGIAENRKPASASFLKIVPEPKVNLVSNEPEYLRMLRD